jgi:soluble lytic murein transglycosylase-like protein
MNTELPGSSGYILVTDKEIVIHGPSGEIRTPNPNTVNPPPKIQTGGAAAPFGGIPSPNLVAPPEDGGNAGSPSLSQEQFLKKYRPYFEAASKATGMPVDLLAAIAWKESRGMPNAPGGGMMQIDPTPRSDANPQGGAFEQEKAKHPDLIKGDINDPASNIMAAAFYLKEQKDRFGSWQLALRAYNSGPEGTDVKNPNARPAGTGDPQYVTLVMKYWGIISSGKGQLPP